MAYPQENLIIGDALADDFFRINSQLRQSTTRLQEQATGQPVDQYNPWSCAIPIYGHSLLGELIRRPEYVRGSLLVDEAYLGALGTALIKMIARDQATQQADDRWSSYPLLGASSAWMPATPVTSGVSDLVAAGRQLLMQSWPAAERLYDDLVEYVVELRASSPARRRGFCTDFARGAIFREIPHGMTAWDMGLDLANGLAHQALHVWKSVDPLLSSSHEDAILSIRRNRVKPAIQFLHEVVALAFTLRFACGCKTNKLLDSQTMRLAESAIAEMRDALRLSLVLLKSNCTLTPLGQALLAEVQAVQGIST